MATKEALENPVKFKDSFGNIIIIGPDAPVGKKSKEKSELDLKYLEEL